MLYYLVKFIWWLQWYKYNFRIRLFFLQWIESSKHLAFPEKWISSLISSILFYLPGMMLLHSTSVAISLMVWYLNCLCCFFNCFELRKIFKQVKYCDLPSYCSKFSFTGYILLSHWSNILESTFNKWTPRLKKRK